MRWTKEEIAEMEKLALEKARVQILDEYPTGPKTLQQKIRMYEIAHANLRAMRDTK